MIDTPNFVAGTNGTLKALDNVHSGLNDLQLMFCNTYHLLLQPGKEVMRAAGGLHRFINRQAPIITDSGGFQVFSLAYGSVASELKSKGTKSQNSSVLKINEEGVIFRSYRDGAKIHLTPESSVDMQKVLGADIIIPLDELPPYHMGENALKKSMDRTHRWQMRSLKEHQKNKGYQSMLGVVHGGIIAEYRKLSAQFITQNDFDGYAIGGSLGKDHVQLKQVLDYTIPHLDRQRPCHLLGLGDQQSIDLGVLSGIDTFDSSYPTKAARHGVLYTKNSVIRVKSRAHQNAHHPVDQDCNCYTSELFIGIFTSLAQAKELPIWLWPPFTIFTT